MVAAAFPLSRSQVVNHHLTSLLQLKSTPNLADLPLELLPLLCDRTERESLAERQCSPNCHLSQSREVLGHSALYPLLTTTIPNSDTKTPALSLTPEFTNFTP